MASASRGWGRQYIRPRPCIHVSYHAELNASWSREDRCNTSRSYPSAISSIQAMCILSPSHEPAAHDVDKTDNELSVIADRLYRTPTTYGRRLRHHLLVDSTRSREAVAKISCSSTCSAFNSCSKFNPIRPIGRLVQTLDAFNFVSARNCWRGSRPIAGQMFGNTAEATACVAGLSLQMSGTVAQSLSP